MAKTRREFTMLRQWRAMLNGASPRPQSAGSTGASPPSPVASPSDQAADFARLRRELDRTRMERDVLKKAIGIFAEMPK
jgi:transposase